MGSIALIEPSPPASSLALDFLASLTDLDILEAAEAAATKRAYRTDFRTFSEWCFANDREPLPATPATVAAFLVHEARRGMKPSSLTRRTAGIASAHRHAGFDVPTGHELVRKTMRGISRSVGAAVTKKTPATNDIILAMLGHCGPSLRGRRDRALLALGFSCAIRRSELVALNVEDLEWVADGLLVHIRRSKTDQEGRGRVIPVPHGRYIRPVQAVRDWLDHAGIRRGPLLRAVMIEGTVEPGPMSPRNVARIIKSYVEKVGRDPGDFSGHSLRRGFLTSGAIHGAGLAKMQGISGHKRVDTLMGYIEDARLFVDHAGAAFL